MLSRPHPQHMILVKQVYETQVKTLININNLHVLPNLHAHLEIKLSWWCAVMLVIVLVLRNSMIESTRFEL
jgi:hypothetical protein